MSARFVKRGLHFFALLKKHNAVLSDMLRVTPGTVRRPQDKLVWKSL